LENQEKKRTDQKEAKAKKGSKNRHVRQNGENPKEAEKQKMLGKKRKQHRA